MIGGNFYLQRSSNEPPPIPPLHSTSFPFSDPAPSIMRSRYRSVGYALFPRLPSALWRIVSMSPGTFGAHLPCPEIATYQGYTMRTVIR